MSWPHPRCIDLEHQELGKGPMESTEQGPSHMHFSKAPQLHTGDSVVQTGTAEQLLQL